MGIGPSYVIYVADILDCVKEITMKSDAMVIKIHLLRNLPGNKENYFRIFLYVCPLQMPSYHLFPCYHTSLYLGFIYLCNVDPNMILACHVSYLI